MRTEAIMTVFALCCALLIEPLRDVEDGVKFAASLERYLARRRATPRPEALAVAAGAVSGSSAVAAREAEAVSPAPRQSRRPWGAGIEWPEEWRNSTVQDGQSNPKSDTKDTSKIER